MTAAAGLLGVNQTTVSRRLAQAESNLGATLFERRPNGVSPTEAGRRALRAANEVESVVGDLERDVMGRDLALAGSLVVSTTDAVAHYLPTLFSTFAAAHAEVVLTVDTSPMARSLSRREADVAIRWTRTPSEGLWGRKLIDVDYAIYGARELVDTVGSTDPAAYPWVTYAAVARARMQEAWMRRHVPDVTVVARYTTQLALQAAIRSGCGIGFMPCGFAAGDASLVRFPGGWPDFAFPLWIVTHADLSRTARVRAFIAHTSRYVDARRAAFG